MSITFDTLGYSRRLAGAGVPQDQADAHAEAAKDFIMSEQVTKADLEVLEARLTLKLGAMFAGGLSILFALLQLAG